MTVDPYDVPIEHLRRFKLGWCDRYGTPTRAGRLASAEAGVRDATGRLRLLLTERPQTRHSHPELLRDWFRRRRFWRQRVADLKETDNG